MLLSILTWIALSVLLSPITEPLPTCMFYHGVFKFRKDVAVNSNLLKLVHSVLSGLLILASLKQVTGQLENVN